MNYKLLIIGLVTAAIIAAGFLWIADMNNSVIPQAPKGDEPVGALTGPDIPSKYLRVGGVRHHYHHQNFSSATTTICSAQGPAATSTIESVLAVFGNSSTSASTIDLGYGTHSNATTTTIASAALSPNDQTHFSFASTTVISPNTWVTIGMQGGNTGVFSPEGACNIIFQSTI